MAISVNICERLFAGQYLIDPLLPISPLVTGGQRRVDKQQQQQPHTSGEHVKNIKNSLNSWLGLSQTPHYNASFRTDHGAINIELAVVGTSPPSGPSRREPARVKVSSHHGKVMVNLVSPHLHRTRND